MKPRAEIVDPRLCAYVISPDKGPYRCDVTLRSTIRFAYPKGEWEGHVIDVPEIKFRAGSKKKYVLPHGYYDIHSSDGRPVPVIMEYFSREKHGNLLAEQLNL